MMKLVAFTNTVETANLTDTYPPKVRKVDDELSVFGFEGKYPVVRSGRVCWKEIEIGKGYIRCFISYKNHLFYLATLRSEEFDSFNFQEAILENSLLPKIEQFYNEVQNPEIYEEQMRLRKEKQEKEQKERLERETAIKREKAEKEAAAFEQAEKDYRNGKNISSEMFEKLAKKYGINIHIRTIGVIRKSLWEVNKETFVFYGRRSSNGLNGVVKARNELNKAMNLF